MDREVDLNQVYAYSANDDVCAMLFPGDDIHFESVQKGAV